MERLTAKPSGSVIEERDDWDGLTLLWRPPAEYPQRFFVTAFLGFWLCGWAFGWISVAGQIARGHYNLFLVGWLGAWTVGGGAAIWALWNLVRPARPESVTLGLDHFGYDPGHSPTDIFMRYGRGSWYNREPTRRLRKPIAVAKSELGKFLLDRVGERQRLSFDRGAERVEIGASLGEPEREWLHATLERWRLGEL